MSMFANQRNTNNIKHIKKLVTGAVAVILVLIVALSCFTIVPVGRTGVVVQMGAITGTILPEGLHPKIPFIQQVVRIDNRVQLVTVDSSSASKDLQTVRSTIALNYRVDNTQSADLYQRVGMSYENVIIVQAIHECVKAVTAKYTAEELITQRQNVSDEMSRLISEKINPRGLLVEIFNITNFEFSEEFNKAIEAKQTAQQNALRAEQELEKARVDAQQKVEQAKADATAIQAKADAEAYAIEKIQQQLAKDPMYIQYIVATNWDGRQPLVIGSGANILDLGRLMDMAQDDAVNGNPGGNTEVAPDNP